MWYDSHGSSQNHMLSRASFMRVKEYAAAKPFCLTLSGNSNKKESWNQV